MDLLYAVTGRRTSVWTYCNSGIVVQIEVVLFFHLEDASLQRGTNKLRFNDLKERNGGSL